MQQIHAAIRLISPRESASARSWFLHSANLKSPCLCVPSYCAGQARGRLIIVCGASWPMGLHRKNWEVSWDVTGQASSGQSMCPHVSWSWSVPFAWWWGHSMGNSACPDPQANGTYHDHDTPGHMEWPQGPWPMTSQNTSQFLLCWRGKKPLLYVALDGSLARTINKLHLTYRV